MICKVLFLKDAVPRDHMCRNPKKYHRSKLYRSRSRSVIVDKLPHNLVSPFVFPRNRHPSYPPPTRATQLLPARPPSLLRPFRHSLHTSPTTNTKETLLFSLSGTHRLEIGGSRQTKSSKDA